MKPTDTMAAVPAGGGGAMKRVALLFAVALAGAVAPSGLASATHSEGTGPPKDLVAGTGTLVVPQPFPQAPQLHVNAHRHPETGEADGHFYIRYPTTTPTGTFDVRGRVDCLGVLGNIATVIGQIERVRGVSPFAGGGGGFQAGNFVQIRITDNGEPGTLDLANFSPGSPRPQDCTPAPGDLPISHGNYVVHQEPPLQLLIVLDELLAEFERAADCPYGKP
jgi:hypothetical protein